MTPSRVIFLDANVPMYAGGREHPLREPCRAIMRLVAEQARIFVTDAEVLQEIVHRYRATCRWNIGEVVLTTFSTAMLGRIEPIWATDVLAAASLADRYPRLAARDLIHVAVMLRVGAGHIVSADRGFDAVESITRLDPADIDAWRTVFGEGV